MGRHPARTRSEVITVALELVERDGLEALTLRDLGAALGVGHTSVYTHFKDKQELIDALVAHASVDVAASNVPADAGPRTQLRDLAVRARRAFTEHLRLAPALLQASGEVTATYHLSRAILGELTRAGLEGRRLIVAFRALESYIIGMSLFDFGGAPDHLATRVGRHQSIDPTAFASVVTEASTDALNHEAYTTGFDLLLDGFDIHDT